MPKSLIPRLGSRATPPSEKTSPRVSHVTFEGRVLYDPASVIGSTAAREHLREIQTPPRLPKSNSDKVER